MSGRHEPPPNSFSTAEPGENWEDQLTTDAPPHVHVAGHITRQLRSALTEHSQSGLATQAGISRHTLIRILNGTAWPDLGTITRIETALASPLYPNWNTRRRLYRT